MKVPTTEESWLNVANEFESLWNFPNCLGAIDGKHVRINAPPSSGSQFYCYKGFFSIVLMAVVDAKYRFLMVDVGSNGCLGDRGVWARSPSREAIEKNVLNLPGKKPLNSGYEVPHVFIGDEAFPLKDYFLRPYTASALNHQQRIYNYRLSRARRVVENAFGLLTAVWRVYTNPIAIKVENASKIVLATCLLHNLLRAKREMMETVDGENTASGKVLPGSWRNIQSTFTEVRQASSNFSSQSANSIRETYCEYFNTTGTVDWQERFINNY